MKLFIHHPIFRLLSPLVIGSLGYLCILLVFDRIGQLLSHIEPMEWGLCVMLAYLLMESQRWLSQILDQRLPYQEGLSKRILLQICIGMGSSLVLLSLGISAFFMGILGFRHLSSFAEEFYAIQAVFLFFASCYHSLVISIAIIQLKNEQEWSQESHRQLNLVRQLMRFRQDIQVDLLYVGLEAIIPYLHHAPQQAEELLEKLSQVYRFTLSQRHQELVSLKAELSVVDALIYVWEQRYPRQISWMSEHALAQQNHYLVPGCLAQCISYFIQNCLFSAHQPLHIAAKYEDQRLLLSVRRNDRISPTADAGKHLLMLQEAFARFTEQPLEEVLTTDRRSLSIPLLQLNPKPDVYVVQDHSRTAH